MIFKSLSTGLGLLCIAAGGCSSADDLGPPTSEVSLSFEVDLPNVGDEDFICFAFDAPNIPSRSMRAIRWTPPEASGLQLHHAILVASGEGYPDGPRSCEAFPNGQILHSWAPGGEPFELPAGVGLALPSNTLRFIIQTHLLRVEPGPAKSASVAISFYEEPPEHSGIWIKSAGSVPVIQPHATERSERRCRVDSPLRAVGVWPHMHRAGTEFHGTIIRAGGERVPFVDLVPWDWNDQVIHPIAVDIGAGDEIEAACAWENTTDKAITPGPHTSQEMCEQSIVVWPAESANCAHSE